MGWPFAFKKNIFLTFPGLSHFINMEINMEICNTYFTLKLIIGGSKYYTIAGKVRGLSS